MFNKKPKPYTELLGKTNRIVEGTIIKGDIVSKADFRIGLPEFGADTAPLAGPEELFLAMFSCFCFSFFSNSLLASSIAFNFTIYFSK